MPSYTRRQWVRWTAASIAGSALLAACGRPATKAAPPAGAPVAGLPLTAFQMLGPAAGWAQSGSAVYRTQNGGSTWSTVSPPAQPVAGGVVTSFSGPDGAAAAVATAAGISVFSTADGGAHWTAAQVPAAAGLVPRFCTFLSDRTHGWLWAAGPSASQGAEPGTLFASTDGGASWSAATAAAAGGSGSLPAAGIKSGLSFRDATHGFMSGTDVASKGVAWLYATDDGGKTWAPQSLPLTAAYRKLFLGTQAATFFDAANGVLPLLIQQAQIPTLCVCTTADGGATWKATLPISSPYAALTASFADAAHWFASDGVGVYATSDAGQDWNAFLTQPQKVLQGLGQIDFPSATLGFALIPAAPTAKTPSPTQLLRTGDGGQTWQAAGA